VGGPSLTEIMQNRRKLHFLICQRLVTLSAAAALLLSAAELVSGAATAPEKQATTITGGTKAQRMLLREVVHAMGGTQIRGVRIESAGDGAYLDMQPAHLDRSRANVSIRVAWEAHVTAFSFAKRSRAHGLQSVAGLTVLGRLTSFRNMRGRVLPPFDRGRIVRPVSRALEGSGARLIEFNLFRPEDPALAVVVATPTPARFIEKQLGTIITTLNTVARRIDGFYVAVTDGARSVVLAYGRVDLPPGVLSTNLYVRPDLIGCAESLPVENEVAPDGAPPCPSG